MKRTNFIAVLLVTVTALTAGFTRRALADDETSDTSIKVVAPLDAANCSATPPTISTLGLSIDVSSAAFNPGESRVSGPITAVNCPTGSCSVTTTQTCMTNSDCPTGETCNLSGTPTITVLGLTIDVSAANVEDGGDGNPVGCAGLAVGNSVEVELASAGTPLAATAVVNQGDDAEAGISGPLQSIDTTGQTVTVLGLTINVASASLDGVGTLGDLVAGQFVEVSFDASQLPNLVGTQLEARPVSTCATLVVGNLVRVKLLSDALDLNNNLDATEVDQLGQDQQGWGYQGWDHPSWDGFGGEVKVQAPIQSFNSGAGTCGTTTPGFCDNAPTTACTTAADCATTPTITVLGLTIDVSQANLDGCDDDSGDGNVSPIDFSTLMVGQFVEMRLASNQPPLAATEVRVLNFANQVEVEVDDESGTPVSDPGADITVQVNDTVAVQVPAKGAGRTKRVHKGLTFKMNTNGRFLVAGLPTGRAKISVRRTANGVSRSGRKSVIVKGNTKQSVNLRLNHR